MSREVELAGTPDKKLYVAILLLAMEDALKFPNPRDREEASKDARLFFRSNNLIPFYNPKKEYRSESEIYSIESRLFLLEDNYFRNFYLSALDLEKNAFVEAFKKKIIAADYANKNKEANLKLKKIKAEIKEIEKSKCKKRSRQRFNLPASG